MKNSNSEGIRRPSAVIFYFLSLALSAINIIVTFIRLISSYTLRVALGGVFGMCLSCVFPFLVMVVLFLKKRNALLFVPLLINSVLGLGKTLSNRYYGSGFLVFLGIVAFISFLPFIVDVLFNVESNYNKMLQKIWFVPAITTAVYSLIKVTLFETYLPFSARIISSVLPTVLSVAIMLTLCRWITNPYKNGYVPETEPQANAQDFSYANVTPDVPPAVTQPIQGKFCTNCGNALKDTDKFCTKCGTRVQGAEPIVTAPAEPSAESTPLFRTTSAIPVGETAARQKR